MSTVSKVVLGILGVLVILALLAVLFLELIGARTGFARTFIMNPFMMRGFRPYGFSIFGGIMMLSTLILPVLVIALIIVGIAAIIRGPRSQGTPKGISTPPAPVEPAAQALTCSNCSRNIQAGWVACPYCGQKLNA